MGPLVSTQSPIGSNARIRLQAFGLRVILAGWLLGAPVHPSTFGQTTPEDTPPTSTAVASDRSAIESALQLIEQMDQAFESGVRGPALADLDKLVERAKLESPNDGRLYYVVGRWQAFSGRQGDAVTALRKYIDSRDGRNDWRAHCKLGDLFVDQFPHLAKSSYEQANALKSDQPDVVYGLARCAEKMGKAPEALSYAKRLVEIAPTSRNRAYLARLYFSQRQFDEAEREARAALDGALQQESRDSASGPEVDIDGFYRLLVDMQRSRINENPSDSNAYLVLAELIVQRGEHTRRTAMLDAAEILQRGIDGVGADAPAGLYEALGVALAEGGRRGDARAAFLALQERDPSNAVAAEWLSKLGDAANPETK